MRNESAPVAARNDPAEITSDANLHVEVTGSTKRFHLWQQVPAWVLGFAAIGLGFFMVLRGYDSAAGWFAVSTAITLSVIIQVGSFKMTGRRVFRMAPLQHHFELLGWAETTIVIRFWLISAMFVALGLGVFYVEWMPK